MAINECCNTHAVTCAPNATIQEAAELMRKHHVGDIIVVEERDGKRMPIGIVTDRDIVLETVALQLDPSAFIVGDLMSTPLVTVQESAGFVATLRLMRSNKLRRMPVVDDAGALFGIVTLDDLINLLTMELSMIADAMIDQPAREGRLRR